MNPTNYSTTDFNTATLLDYFGFLCAMVDDGRGRITFKYELGAERLEELHGILDKYWKRDLSVEPQELFSAMRNLKSRMKNRG